MLRVQQGHICWHQATNYGAPFTERTLRHSGTQKVRIMLHLVRVDLCSSNQAILIKKAIKTTPHNCVVCFLWRSPGEDGKFLQQKNHGFHSWAARCLQHVQRLPAWEPRNAALNLPFFFGGSHLCPGVIFFPKSTKITKWKLPYLDTSPRVFGSIFLWSFIMVNFFSMDSGAMIIKIVQRLLRSSLWEQTTNNAQSFSTGFLLDRIIHW